MTTSPAEQAVIAVLESKNGCSWHQGCDVEDCYGPRAEAIVTTVRPLIEADALDALADAATSYGPPTAEHLRAMAFVLRQGRMTVRDWLTADTTRTTTPTEGTDR